MGMGGLCVHCCTGTIFHWLINELIRQGQSVVEKKEKFLYVTTHRKSQIAV